MQEVAVRVAAPIARFNISPHAAGITATADGPVLRFKVDRPLHLVVTINGGEESPAFAEPPDPEAPRPGQPGVTNIQDLGVDATGGRLETARLQQAIDRVAAESGTSFFPRGTYLAGTLSFKSNLTDYLDKGARLLGSTDPADYPVDADDGRLKFDPNDWKNKEGVDIASSRTIAHTRLILRQGRPQRPLRRPRHDRRPGQADAAQNFRPQLVHIRSPATSRSMASRSAIPRSTTATC